MLIAACPRYAAHANDYFMLRSRGTGYGVVLDLRLYSGDPTGQWAGYRVIWLNIFYIFCLPCIRWQN
jgi:hypothetical protein